MQCSKRYLFVVVALAVLLASSAITCSQRYTQQEFDTACEESHTEGYEEGFREGEASKELAVEQAYDDGRNKGWQEGCSDCQQKTPGTVVPPTGTVVPPTSGPFVGSINSDVYHYPSCHYVERIHTENKIWFSSASDARAHGYRPCKVCRPP